ncbi:MAG: secretin N-terminal domain-containing protein [Candidatus Sedimenticola sp. PURPLELP]
MITRLLLPLLWLFLLTPVALADYPLEIIELKSRPVEDVIPIIKPFIGSDGVVTGMNNQLIIRTSPSNLLEIRELLDLIDRPARRLMIHVRQGSTETGAEDRLAAGIRAGDGDNNLGLGSAPQKPGARMQYRESRTGSRRAATHSIQTLEGKPAFIESGKIFPVEEHSLILSGDTLHLQTTNRYKSATSGFYVTPHLSGDRVTLHISPFMTRPGVVQGTFDVQEASTVVTGKLGVWIPVGGVIQDDKSKRTGILKRRRSESRSDRQTLLLVEEVTR